jgi:hypothetical protein
MLPQPSANDFGFDHFNFIQIIDALVEIYYMRILGSIFSKACGKFIHAKIGVELFISTKHIIFSHIKYKDP